MTKTMPGAREEEPKRRTGRRIRKRSNGEGSIWPRKDGRYGYAAFVQTTAGTVKRQGSARTQEDARKKLTELLRQADEGIPVSSENWTLADFLNYWLKNIVSQEWCPKTYQGYEGVVRLHLIPGLGKKRLGKLNAQDVRLFINRVRSECQCCRNGWDASREKPVCCALKGGQCYDSRLSTRMVQSIHAVLRNAPECAVREEIIARNVAKLQGPGAQVQGQSRPHRPGARAVLKAARDHRLYALYVLALCLGLRRGNSSGSAGRTSTLRPANWKWSRASSGSRVASSSSARRPPTQSGLSRCRLSAWRPCGSTEGSSSPNARTAGRSGRNTASSSPHAAGPRWNRTTYGEAGEPSARPPA